MFSDTSTELLWSIVILHVLLKFDSKEVKIVNWS